MSLIDRLAAVAATLRAQCAATLAQADELDAVAAALEPVAPPPVEPPVEPPAPPPVDPPAPPPAEPPAPPPVEPPPVDPPPVEPGQAPQLLRVLDLGTTGPYITTKKGVFDTGENSTYNRKDTLIDPRVQGPQVWQWAFAAGKAPKVLPRMRMLLDGSEAAPWREADSDGTYRFTVDLVNGHHVAHAEAEGMDTRCIGVPFVVNDTGTPLPLEQQTPWTVTKRFDADSGGKCVAVQVRWPGAHPAVPTAPLRPRAVEPYSERLKMAHMWGRHCTTNTYRPMNRRWLRSPLGDVLLVNEQKYFHSTAIDNHATPRRRPLLPLIDGPRGVGTLGYLCDIRIRRGGQSAYALDTAGRLVRIRFGDGDVLTEVGPRIKPGALGVHPGVWESSYMHYKDRTLWNGGQDAYCEQWEDVEDRSQLDDKRGLWEPWGFAVAMRLSDGSITNRDGHEFWIPSTRLHCINYYDHWTAHSPEAFQKAHFPPLWYIQADGPTGKTTACRFIGTPGTPTDYCNEPWQCKVREQDGLLYWTNFMGDSIYRCRLDGTGIEPVLVSSIRPTDADLTAPGRLEQSIEEPIDIRAKWVIDGPVGNASCVRPMSFDFDSQGNIVFVERYSYAVRRLDLSAMTVTTLCAIKDRNGGSASSGNNEPVLVVDHDGSCGPVDDIFVQAWSNASNKRFDRSGALIEWAGGGGGSGALFARGGNGELPNGPSSYLTPPGYAWGLDAYAGIIIGAGNAAGSQWQELTKRQPGQPDIDIWRWRRGIEAFNASGVGPIVHGSSGGQGLLGFPTWESMTGWTDDEVTAEMRRMGVAEESLADVLYCVRWVCQEHVPA